MKTHLPLHSSFWFSLPFVGPFCSNFDWIAFCLWSLLLLVCISEGAMNSDKRIKKNKKMLICISLILRGFKILFMYKNCFYSIYAVLLFGKGDFNRIPLIACVSATGSHSHMWCSIIWFFYNPKIWIICERCYQGFGWFLKDVCWDWELINC